MVENYAPMLAAACVRPYWVCVYGSLGAAEPELELWTGRFDAWEPEEWPAAIVAVTPSTVSVACAPGRGDRRRSRRRRGPARGGRRRRARAVLICAVGEDGDAYAMVIWATGRQVSGVPSAGHLLDMMRQKLLLSPGRSSPYSLELPGAGGHGGTNC